jgi:hypothetical protein
VAIESAPLRSAERTIARASPTSLLAVVLSASTFGANASKQRNVTFNINNFIIFLIISTRSLVTLVTRHFTRESTPTKFKNTNSGVGTQNFNPAPFLFQNPFRETRAADSNPLTSSGEQLKKGIQEINERYQRKKQ